MDNKSDIVHLVYVSAATIEISEDDFNSIIRTLLKIIPSRGITGMILYSEGSFLQLIEGKRHEVDMVYERIREDYRHTNILKIYEESVDRRYFKEWCVAVANLPACKLEGIHGCSDFFRSGKTLRELEETTARKILNAFKDGKWRQHLSEYDAK